MKTHSLARMTALVAVLALGLGASPAEALKLYSQSGSSCQPYWRNSETIHSRSVTGANINHASSHHLMICPVQFDSGGQAMNSVFANVYASVGVACYLARNSFGNVQNSTIDTNDTPGGWITIWMNIQNPNVFEGIQLVCNVPSGGSITTYHVGSHG